MADAPCPVCTSWNTSWAERPVCSKNHHFGRTRPASSPTTTEEAQG